MQFGLQNPNFLQKARYEVLDLFDKLAFKQSEKYKHPELETIYMTQLVSPILYQSHASQHYSNVRDYDYTSSKYYLQIEVIFETLLCKKDFKLVK